MDKVEVTLNITDIVRAEVKAALKSMLSLDGDTNTNIHKSGDYTGPIKPKGDGGGDDGTPPMKTLPVKVVKDGEIQYRRKKRTREEMEEAITKALPIVQGKHPDWSERRLKRLAKNLVRRYKIEA